MQYNTAEPEQLAEFLNGKPEHTIALFDYFLTEFVNIGPVTIHPTKSMIGIANSHKRIAWVTQLGRSFIHVVFPFDQPYEDNLCFQKIAQVPGQRQFNHHFRMLQTGDVNDEVRGFMTIAYQQ